MNDSVKVDRHKPPQDKGDEVEGDIPANGNDEGDGDHAVDEAEVEQDDDVEAGGVGVQAGDADFGGHDFGYVIDGANHEQQPYDDDDYGDGYDMKFVDAIRNGDLKAVKERVAAGADVGEILFEEGWPAVHVAASYDKIEIIEYLLDEGVEVDARTERDFTPLMIACANHQPATTKCLLGRGAKVEAVDIDGHTPIFFAHAPDTLQCLLDQGANIDKQDNEGNTPLHCAAYIRHSCELEKITFLLSHGADLNIVNNEGKLAYELETTDEIKEAIIAEQDRRRSHGFKQALIESPDEDDEGEEEEEDEEVDAGADDDDDGDDGGGGGGRGVIVKGEQDAGHHHDVGEVSGGEEEEECGREDADDSDVDDDDSGYGSFGDSKLMVAVRRGDLKKVKELVAAGENVRKTNNNGMTAIHLATNYGSAEVVSFLLEQGAELDTKDVYGRTPRHLAVGYDGKLESAALLLECGTDLNLLDNVGQVALDVANTDEIKEAIIAEQDRRRSHGFKQALIEPPDEEDNGEEDEEDEEDDGGEEEDEEEDGVDDCSGSHHAITVITEQPTKKTRLH